MRKQKKFAKVLDRLYKEERSLRDRIEKSIIEILKSNDLSHFRFERPIAVCNNDDFSNEGKVFGVYVDVLDTDETQDCLGIEAAWKASDFEIEEDYNATDFYIDDLVEIYDRIYAQMTGEI